MKANKFSINGEVKLDLTQDTVTEEDVAAGKTFHKADGSEAVGVATIGGGAELNIAYGDTAPEDTSKLWVKTTEPSGVKVDSEIEKVPSDECSAVVVDSTIKPKQRGHAQVGTKVYMFSGYYNGYTNSIFTYDLETQELVELAVKVPQILSWSTACAVGTKIYIFGGWYSECKNTIYCFDTVTETISTLEATLPTVSQYLSSVSVGSKIYIFGGETDGYAILDQILCFDSESLTISQLNTVLPTVLKDIGCVAYGNSIYLFGGKTKGTSGGEIPTNKILKFDCETETVTTCASVLPKDVSGSGCVLMEDAILILGGYFSNSIYLFDCNSETVTTLSVVLPEQKYLACVGALDNNVWLIGGYAQYSDTNKTILFTFGMSVIVSVDTLHVQSTLDNNIFNLLNTDTIKAEIGVKAVFKGNADNIGEQVEAALHNGTDWVTI